MSDSTPSLSQSEVERQKAMFHLHALAEFAKTPAARSVTPEELPVLAKKTICLIDKFLENPSGGKTLSELKEVCPLLEGCLWAWMKMVEHPSCKIDDDVQAKIVNLEGEIAHAASDLVELHEGLDPETMSPCKLAALRKQEGCFDLWFRETLVHVRKMLIGVQEIPGAWGKLRSGCSAK